jgi:hypothetical protein
VERRDAAQFGNRKDRAMDIPLEDVCVRLNARNRLILGGLSIDNAIANAERVLEIFESANPEDDRPRKAIEATRAVRGAVDRFLDGQAEWGEVEQFTKALEIEANAVSMDILYTAKPWSVLLAADTVNHANLAASEIVGGNTLSGIRCAACAAHEATVSRWLVEIGEVPSDAVQRQKGDIAYNATLIDFHRIAARLLADQAEP